LPVLDDCNPNVVFSGVRGLDRDVRHPVQVSTGMHVEGYACPHPDPGHARTMGVGVLKRAAAKLPDPDLSLVEEFSVFVRKLLHAEFVPLPTDENLNIDHWLVNTHYPFWRREELKTKHDANPTFEEWMATCKCFMKDEVYPEYKYARGIYSRTDEYKCLVGPWFKAIEKQVFKSPWFVKNVPVKDRPKYLYDRLYRPRSTYKTTDFTSFESQFRAILMEACEFQLYDYMTQNIRGQKDFMSLIRSVQAGVNLCSFKRFSFKIPATRMSGEMCTSLGNGFFNMAVTRFMCERAGVTNLVGVFEGDDGVTRGDGIFPTVGDFSKLGLILKMESVSNLNEASFCGLIFDEADLCNLVDPRDELVTLGFVKMPYAHARDKKLQALLRCKGLSLLHQYAGCPIVQELAISVLRLTRTVDVRHLVANSGMFNEYERGMLLEAVEIDGKWQSVVRKVGERSRELVARTFKIPVDMQFEIEKYLASLKTIGPMVIPHASFLFPRSWQAYYSSYATQLGCVDLIHMTPQPSPLGFALTERLPAWLLS